MNIAYIDGQNLYMGTKKIENPWKISLSKFRIYLKEKYFVSEAYYFLGFVQEEYEDLYEEIQKAGFILKFREHNSAMLGKKKGNVDSDIIFSIMKKLYRNEIKQKVVLVSGDGDYKQIVDFLIEENKFEVLVAPNKKYLSSLYFKIKSDRKIFLDDTDIQRKIS